MGRVYEFDNITEKHMKDGDARYKFGKQHAGSYVGREIRYAIFDDVKKEKIYHKPFDFEERIRNIGYVHQRKNVQCAQDKKRWSTKPIEEALNYSYIRVNPYVACYYIIVDVDSTTKPELMARFKQIGIYPHIMVGSPVKDNSWHLFFGLQFTEFQTNHLVKRVRHILTTLLYGDINYTNHFAKNPLAPNFRDVTYFFNISNYTIEDLYRRANSAIEHLPRVERRVVNKCLAQLNARSKYIAHLLENSSGSRNVDTFRLFSSAAREYSVTNLKNDKRYSGARIDTLEKYLRNQVAPKHPSIVRDLPQSEIKSIAKSVARYTIDVYDGRSAFMNKNKFKQVEFTVMEKIEHAVTALQEDHETLEIIASRIKSEHYNQIAEKYNITEYEARLAVRAVRGLYGIKVDNRKERDWIEDPVKAVKEAAYIAREEEERVHFERVEIKTVQERIFKAGRKERQIMRENGATEEELEKHRQLIAQKAKNAVDELNASFKYYNKCEELFDIVDLEDKYNPAITGKTISSLPLEQRIPAVLEKIKRVVEVTKRRNRIEEELLNETQDRRERKRFFMSKRQSAIEKAHLS